MESPSSDRLRMVPRLTREQYTVLCNRGLAFLATAVVGFALRTPELTIVPHEGNGREVPSPSGRLHHDDERLRLPYPDDLNGR